MLVVVASLHLLQYIAMLQVLLKGIGGPQSLLLTYFHYSVSSQSCIYGVFIKLLL